MKPPKPVARHGNSRTNSSDYQLDRLTARSIQDALEAIRNQLRARLQPRDRPLVDRHRLGGLGVDRVPQPLRQGNALTHGTIATYVNLFMSPTT